MCSTSKFLQIKKIQRHGEFKKIKLPTGTPRLILPCVPLSRLGEPLCNLLRCEPHKHLSTKKYRKLPSQP